MPDFNRDEWVQRLDDAKVEYILVGGLAVAVHGFDY